MRSLEEILALSGVRALLDEICALLADGYDDASDNYRPNAGSDGRTNGIDTYTFTWHQIHNSGIVKATSHEPYRFELGGEMVACHRVATESPADIEASFPRNRDSWPITYPRQLGLGFEPLPSAERLLVLAHIGNPAQGLLEVYLCRPLVDEHHRLLRWLQTSLVWKKGTEIKSPCVPRPLPDAAPLPEEERKPLAKAKKKDKGKDKVDKKKMDE